MSNSLYRNVTAGLGAGAVAAIAAVIVSLPLVSPDDMRMLYDAAYSKLGWDHERLKGFIRRQLGGRDQVRTLADFNKVWLGVQAQVRRLRKANKPLTGVRGSASGGEASRGTQC